jgi:asparagine synthase (glutamine-hydrolysing)
MGAIYGILGDGSLAEVETMGLRLAHRGSQHVEWSLGSGLHFGQRVSPRHSRSIATGGIVALDGLIENLEELAALLDRSPGLIRHRDCEGLILDLFHQFGPDCFRYLKGAFAIALWDPKHEALVLARDLFGARSLSYAVMPDRFVFASEYKALLALADVPATPNLDAIQFINSTRTALSDASCLAEAFPVPPGHWVRVERLRLERRRYWQPELRVARRSETEHIQAFRQSFLRSVQRQVVNYERIGVALSGGLDAASVVAGIRHVAPDRKIHTFCAGFGPEDPELVGAAETAQHFKTVHHAIVVDPTDLFESLPPMTWHLEDPIGREDIPYIYACARAARGMVDVMLGGHMIDLLLGGMPRHMLVRLAHLVPLGRTLFGDLFRYTRAGQKPRTRLGAAVLRCYFRDGVFPPPRVRGAANLPEIDLTPISGSEPLTEHLRQSLMSYQGQGGYDRLQAAFAVDLQTPFGDPDLVSGTFQIPDRLKIRGRIHKYILREALKGMLPPSISARRKSFARLRNDIKLAEVIDSLADQLLSAAAVRERNIFEPGYIDRVRRRGPGRPYSAERLYRLWTMLLTEIWFRTFVDRRGAFPAGSLW